MNYCDNKAEFPAAITLVFSHIILQKSLESVDLAPQETFVFMNMK